jgi:aminopeptidase-like protein
MNLEEKECIFSNLSVIGTEMFQLMNDLFPICRSITGNGVRKSFELIKNYLDVELFEVASGTKVNDWTIPKEWNITDAYVIDPNGNKIIDFKNSNLHVVNYSIPVKKKLSLEELKPHLHSIPEQPELIPYKTSYYEEDWGFCLSHNQLLNLKDGDYEVCIDSSLENGALTYGEYFIQGKTDKEIVISCYVCHPSLCNDNLSGVVITTLLAKILCNVSCHYSYRFLFIPETIGAITWLHQNKQNLGKIKHGLVVTCAGDSGSSTYKKTRQGNMEIDKTVQNVLRSSGNDYSIDDFFPMGSDERQFCSPGYNLPFGSLMRTGYGRYNVYHTSGDNFDFVKQEFLMDTFSKYISIFFTLENNRYYKNLNPKGEPQLKKRNLINPINTLLWILNFSDGENSLLDISDKSNILFKEIVTAANELVQSKLLEEIIDDETRKINTRF